MKTEFLILVGMALVVGPLAAQASPVTYDFTVNGGSTGPLANSISSGSFTFDSSIIPSGGENVIGPALLTTLTFTWDGISYNASTANTGSLSFNSTGALTGAVFGTFCGPGFCNLPGPYTPSWYVDDTLFDYVLLTSDNVFHGSVTLTEAQPTSVPEPGALALFGLGLFGLATDLVLRSHGRKQPL